MNLIVRNTFLKKVRFYIRSTHPSWSIVVRPQHRNLLLLIKVDSSSFAVSESTVRRRLVILAPRTWTDLSGASRSTMSTTH